MRRAAIEVVRDAPDANPGDIVAVGGTASNLIKVLPAAMLDRTLTRERIAEVQSILASEPAAVAAERHLINPLRARILPAGGAIMDAILERYGAASIRVSEAGIREGAVLAVEHGGRSWRDRLRRPRPRLARLEPPGPVERYRPRDDPPERPPEGDPGDAAPRRPDRAAQPRHLAFAADQVATDRGALER